MRESLETSLQNSIRVALFDRQTIFRAGVRQILSSYEDIEVVAECDPSEDVASLIENFPPDVALVDINMPATTGVALARRISQFSPVTKVITMSSYFGEEELFDSIKAGAGAYLNKNVSPNELAESIRKVYREEYPVDEYLLRNPELARKVLKQFQELSLMEEEIADVTVPLTARENEILTQIADGHSNKQIARTFHLSEQTIKNHVTSIMRKLNANDRTHAVILALCHGWISLEKKDPEEPAATLS